MTARRIGQVAAFVLLVLAGALPARAQMPDRAPDRAQPPRASDLSAQRQRPAYARPRIEITPRRLLYRRCTDGYELQYRPSGTVLFPYQRCHWVRG